MFNSSSSTISGGGSGNSAGGGAGARGQASRADASGNGRPPGQVSPQEIKAEVHRRLLATLDLNQARRMPREQLHQECSRRVDLLLSEQRCPLSSVERQRILREVMDEIFGLGPLEELLR